MSLPGRLPGPMFLWGVGICLQWMTFWKSDWPSELKVPSVMVF